jgi:hypothetical protein
LQEDTRALYYEYAEDTGEAVDEASLNQTVT